MRISELSHQKCETEYMNQNSSGLVAVSKNEKNDKLLFRLCHTCYDVDSIFLKNNKPIWKNSVQ